MVAVGDGVGVGGEEGEFVNTEKTGGKREEWDTKDEFFRIVLPETFLLLSGSLGRLCQKSLA
jgi:hypothetical protein